MQLFDASWGWVVFFVGPFVDHHGTPTAMLVSCGVAALGTCLCTPTAAAQSYRLEWPTTKQIWRFHQPWQVAISMKVTQKNMMIISVCHTLWWQLGSGTDSSVSSSSGLALWLLENGAELNPRASVREDDAGRGDWAWRMPSLLSIPMYPMKSQVN